MASLHQFKLSGFESSSKKAGHAELKEVESGFVAMREAIAILMARPKAEREAHLARISEEMETIISRFEPLDGQGAGRLSAAREIIDLLEQVSKKQ